MLNISPGISGLRIARHLQISYSSAYDLASTAFWNGLKLRLETTSRVRTSGARALTLRNGGLLIRIDRGRDSITVRTSHDGGAWKALHGLNDMREVLGIVRTAVEKYQRPRRPEWAVVPVDQYQFIKFL